MRKYLPPGEAAEPTVVDGEAIRDRAVGGAGLAGARHSK
jgi:hypothetical protein